MREEEMIRSKVPYRGHHLVLVQENGTFRVRILDERNNTVQPGSSVHATEEGALDEARQIVDSLVGQH
jgi:hypothetical protein